MTDDLNYDDIDPGIRAVVRLLRANGFDTCDSGDGESKYAGVNELTTDDIAALAEGSMGCAEPVPNVYMQVEVDTMVGEARRLRDLIAVVARADILAETVAVDEQEGPRVQIQASYSPIDGGAILSLHGVADRDLKPENVIR